MNTFKRPLTPKRTDFSFKSGVFDYKYIREHAAPNPFGIEPDAPPVPWSACSNPNCNYRWRTVDNKSENVGTCAGYCMG